MLLVGSTRSYVASPFLMHGMILGLLGAIIAIVLLHYGQSYIAGTLDEIQWVYQTDKNYWDKVVGPRARCGCGQGTPPCDPMKWSIRQIPVTE